MCTALSEKSEYDIFIYFDIQFAGSAERLVCGSSIERQVKFALLPQTSPRKVVAIVDRCRVHPAAQQSTHPLDQPCGIPLREVTCAVQWQCRL